MNQPTHCPPALVLAFAAVIALHTAGIDLGLTRSAAAQEMAAETLAAHVRIQGHRCSKAISADRDAEQSRPDAAVWIVKCTEGAYRVQLMPHQAAKIESIEAKQ